MSIKKYGKCNLFPTFGSYCSDIVEGKNVSAVRSGLVIGRPSSCHRFIATVTDFETMDKHDIRIRLHTSHAHSIVRDCRKNRDIRKGWRCVPGPVEKEGN